MELETGANWIIRSSRRKIFYIFRSKIEGNSWDIFHFLMRQNYFTVFCRRFLSLLELDLDRVFC